MILCNQCGNALGGESIRCPVCGSQAGTNKSISPETVNSNSGSPTPAVLPAPSSEAATTGGPPIAKYVIIALLALIAGGGFVALLRPNKVETVSNTPNASSPSPADDSKKEKNANREQIVSNDRPALTAAAPISQPPSGTWFVVLGSFPKYEREKADQRLQSVQGSGYSASIVDTDDYPGFRGGLWAVVIGPYTKAYARRTADQIKVMRPDAYIKSGW